LFDRAELLEQGEKIGLITGLRALSIAEPIKTDSANRYFLLCRCNPRKCAGMSSMYCPANDDPIVRAKHFIDIEAGIRKRAGKILIVALGALDASARGLVTVVNIVVGKDLTQDGLVLLVVRILKTLNRVQIRL
jgi:hypothetical protein